MGYFYTNTMATPMKSSLLARIKRGNPDLPPRIVVAGVEGIGKSTLAAGFPEPLFISAEEGLTGLDHIQRFSPESFPEILQLCDELLRDSGGFQTIVFDTVDWLERMIHNYLITREQNSKIQSIEDFGYGKGYVAAEAELAKLLSKLDALHKAGMGVILISHVHIKPFNSPTGEVWDRYEMKGHKRFTGMLREWPDACLFAVYEVFQTTQKDGGRNREKTIGGDRVLHTTWSPAWDAKNRFGLPDTIPLSYEAFKTAMAEAKAKNAPEPVAKPEPKAKAKAAPKVATPEEPAEDAEDTAKLIERIRELYPLAEIPEAEQKAWDDAIKGIDTMPADRLKKAIARLEQLTDPAEV